MMKNCVIGNILLMDGGEWGGNLWRFSKWKQMYSNISNSSNTSNSSNSNNSNNTNNKSLDNSALCVLIMQISKHSYLCKQHDITRQWMDRLYC